MIEEYQRKLDRTIKKDLDIEQKKSRIQSARKERKEYSLGEFEKHKNQQSQVLRKLQKENLKRKKEMLNRIQHEDELFQKH